MRHELNVDTPIFVRGDHVRHPQFEGIALWFVGHPPTVYRDDDGDESEAVDPSTAIVRMVGDDRDFEVDINELEAIDEDIFCGGCGQMGCGHG